jgi:hypothetical protein
VVTELDRQRTRRRPQPEERSYARILTYVVILVIILAAAGVLAYKILPLVMEPPAASSSLLPEPPAVQLAEKITAPPAEDPIVDMEPEPLSPDSSQPPVSEDSQPQVSGEVEPPLPEGFEPHSPWKDAEAVLKKFLSAQSLAERQPLMETQASAEELASSCLAEPLPAVLKMTPELRESNPETSVVDCFFTVDFDSTRRINQPHTILVRTRDSNAPLVVADPFLDSYGGRLAAYAATPTDKSGVFQVVVYAVASCTDPKIPNRDKKLTLKLLSSDNTQEIARAYFGRQSKIAEILEDGNYSLTYGNAKACTVMLRWNTEDNPDRPYLEAIAIKSLGWSF